MATASNDPMEIFCKVIDANQTIPLRHAVLWPNAPVSQVLLPEDDKGIHVGAFIIRGEDSQAHTVDEEPGRSELVAVISLFQESWPEESDKSMIDNTISDVRSDQVCCGGVTREEPSATGKVKEAKVGHEETVGTAVRFRKFACNSSFQGRGFGSQLLEYASQTIAKQKLGAKVIWCDARVATAEWYQKRGMVEFGETFWKSGIEYIRMKREL